MHRFRSRRRCYPRRYAFAFRRSVTLILSYISSKLDSTADCRPFRESCSRKVNALAGRSTSPPSPRSTSAAKAFQREQKPHSSIVQPFTVDGLRRNRLRARRKARKAGMRGTLRAPGNTRDFKLRSHCPFEGNSRARVIASGRKKLTGLWW